MPRRSTQLTPEQAEDLRALLRWTDEEFDVEVVDGPHPDTPKGRWRVRVILGKRHVVVFKPATGHIKMDLRSVGGDRPSTETSDINTAIHRAERFLLELRARQLADTHGASVSAVVSPEKPTLGAIHDLFRTEGLTGFTTKFRKNLLLVMKLVEAYAGRSFDPLQIDAKWVKGFVDWRTTQSVRIRRRGRDGKLVDAFLGPVGGVTAVSNLRDYDQVLAFAHDHRPDGRSQRWLDRNPLREVKSWPKHEKALRERGSDRLYEILMTPCRVPTAEGEIVRPAPVDAADPSGLGIVRTVTAIQYHTARRREAVLGLRCGDVVLGERDVRRTLRRLGGAHRPEWATVFGHGVLVFREELDKNDFGRAFPISEALYQHLANHLARLAAAGYSTADDAPLFPRPTDPACPASESTLYKARSAEEYRLRSGEVRVRQRPGGWYTEALYTARSYLIELGEDPDIVIPTDPDDESKILPGFKAHAWRGLWATKVERLGFGRATSENNELDRHAAFLGSWTILGRGVREERYVQLDARVLMAIASFEDAARFQKEMARCEEESTKDVLSRVAEAANDQP